MTAGIFKNVNNATFQLPQVSEFKNLGSTLLSKGSGRGLVVRVLDSGPGLGSITIVIVIDCNRLQLEHNRNCNRNQIFQIVA